MVCTEHLMVDLQLFYHLGESARHEITRLVSCTTFGMPKIIIKEGNAVSPELVFNVAQREISRIVITFTHYGQ